MLQYGVDFVLVRLCDRISGRFTSLTQKCWLIQDKVCLQFGARLVWVEQSSCCWLDWSVEHSIDGYGIEYFMFVYGDDMRLGADNTEESKHVT